MRQASTDSVELEALLEETEDRLVERHEALAGLAVGLARYLDDGVERWLDKLHVIRKRQLQQLVDELNSALVIYRQELGRMGVDVKRPIALGDGSEERRRWELLLERLKPASVAVRERATAGAEWTLEAVKSRLPRRSGNAHDEESQV